MDTGTSSAGQAGTGATSPGSANGAAPPTPSSRAAPTPSPGRPPTRLSESEKAAAVAELLGTAAGGDERDVDPDPGSGAGTVADRADLVEGLGGAQDGREGAGPSDPSEEADGAPAPQPAPRTLKDAAEALGIDPSELYKLELNTGDGETVTLGALKDAWGDRQTAVRETAQKAAELRERELAIASDRQLWTEIAHELKGVVRPEVLQRIVARDQERRALAERLLLEQVPEFRDPQAWRRFGTELVEQMKPFGIDVSDLAGVRHPGFFRVAKDWMEARAQLKRLLSYQPEKDPPRTRTGSGRGEGGGGSARSAVERARTGSEADKVLGVEALIGEAARRR